MNMKSMKYLAMAALLLLPCMLSAKEVQVQAMTVFSYNFAEPDSEIEWTVFKNDDSKAEIKKKSLELECKRENTSAISTAKFKKVNVGKDFEYTALFKPSKIDNKSSVGIVFDYRDDNNFQALIIDKNKYYYVVCERGQEYVEAQGDCKVKGIFCNVTIKKERNSLKFLVNGIEFGSVKTAKKMRQPNFGVIVNGKNKMSCLAVVLGIPLNSNDDDLGDDDSDEDDDDGGRRRSRSRDYDDED